MSVTASRRTRAEALRLRRKGVTREMLTAAAAAAAVVERELQNGNVPGFPAARFH